MSSKAAALPPLSSHSEIFFNLIDNAPFGVFVIDGNFCLRQVNRGAQKVFRNVRPLIGRDFAQVLQILWPEPFAGETIARFRRTLATGEPYADPNTTEKRHDISEVESYDWKIERIVLPDGQYGVVCYFYDITERRQSEEALRKSEQRCRKFVFLADQSTDFIGMCDMQFKPFYVNKAGLDLAGLDSPEQAFRTPVPEFFFPEDRPYLLNEFFPKVLRDGKAGVEIRFRHFKTGEAIWMYYNVSHIKDAQGVPLGLATISQNISERRRAQDDAQKYAEDLKRSNRELEQFALIASHDLKEPLQLVAGYTNILAKRYKEKLDDKADEFIRNIQDSTGKMSNLIQALLAYAKAGQPGRAFKEVDSQSLCGQAVKNLDVSIAAGGAQVAIGPLPLITADEVQIVQLFQNLIANALKFRSKDVPAIAVSAETTTQEHIFAVRDNGIGIPAEHFTRIFELFSRAHPQGGQPGTGIGLAICKKVVDNHRGRIWVESKVGEGTTFFFTIPL